MSNEKAGAGISTGTLELLRAVPVGGEGHPGGSCESCGLYLWSARYTSPMPPAPITDTIS
jgi:hypothetical protein